MGTVPSFLSGSSIHSLFSDKTLCFHLRADLVSFRLPPILFPHHPFLNPCGNLLTNSGYFICRKAFFLDAPSRPYLQSQSLPPLPIVYGFAFAFNASDFRHCDNRLYLPYHLEPTPHQPLPSFKRSQPLRTPFPSPPDPDTKCK